MIRIVPIAEIEPQAVEHLLDAAFGSDRHERTAYRLREGSEPIASLSFAALADDGLVGSIQCWSIFLTLSSGRKERLVMVGPIAVDPAHQRSGIGRLLTQHAIAVADAAAEDALMLIGDPEYYERFFAFTAEHTGAWQVPGPVERRRLLARLRGDRLAHQSGVLGPDRALQFCA